MPRRRAVPLAALLAGVALVAAACSLPDLTPGGGRDGGDRATPATRPARVPPRKAAPTWATGAPVRVLMNDRFRYQPSSIMVRAGHRVTFEVTNTGKLPHEFILGDRATQLEHEHQMQAGDDMDMHDHMHMGMDADGGGLTVPPGQTRRFSWTFDKPGIVLYGCHVLGHWAAGMHGTIVVLSPDRPLPLAALAPAAR
jgi:uncharacterized cupredoxin-like copper-binding protein